MRVEGVEVRTVGSGLRVSDVPHGGRDFCAVGLGSRPIRDGCCATRLGKEVLEFELVVVRCWCGAEKSTFQPCQLGDQSKIGVGGEGGVALTGVHHSGAASIVRACT